MNSLQQQTIYHIQNQGIPALIVSHCELVEIVSNLAQTVANLIQRIALLESKETPSVPSETVADLGHGWKIEHRPQPTPPIAERDR